MAPEYFKLYLRPYEAEQYLDGVMMRKRDGWEQARLIVSPWSGKDSDPIVFPWEKGEVAEPTMEEIDNAREWAEEVTNILNRKYGKKRDSSEITARL